MTTKTEIEGWLERGKAQGASHMIVVCDTFDHNDYPVFVAPNEDVRKVETRYSDRDMQRVMEVYRLDKDWGEQLSARRSFNY